MLKAVQAKRFNEILKNIALEKGSKGFRATKAFQRKIMVRANDFERRFGLGKMERKTFFQAKKLKIKKTDKTDFYWITFELPKGSYATIFLKFVKEKVE
jgi:tRNA(Glu) U13 pseudouridine synthase TruD